MSNPIIPQLHALRQEMKKHNIDLYIQPSSDPHLSEYVADRFKSREYITGFTGSAGTALVTQNDAVLFTDGRYYIQAEAELAGTSYGLMKIGIDSTPTIPNWIAAQVSPGDTIGLDARLFSHKDFDTLKNDLKHSSCQFSTEIDLMSNIWRDRPLFPKTPVFIHDLCYTGINTQAKLKKIRQIMSSCEANTYLLSSLNDIAWLFNIRARDVAYTPVAYAYALVTDIGAFLYVDKDQINDDVIVHLADNQVTARNYCDFYKDLTSLNDRHVLYDPAKINALMTASLPKNNVLIEADDPTYMMKASLNPTEKQNLINAQIRDGVAMVNFLHWFDDRLATSSLTEHEAKVQLETFRAQQPLFIEPSFNTIPAYGANGAMMHYSTPKVASPTIETHGLFLLDSGGQYYDGTTDITRTIATGPVTAEEIRDFTLVVKGHIRLNRLVFLQGVTGTNIDIIARQCMWENFMDYKSGTGHSIGYLLGVHEGPGRIKKEPSEVILKPGMVLTNEPGVYKEGRYGIRIENTLVIEKRADNPSGTYLGFEVISFCPIDTRCIDPEMLEPKELQWLNDYHQRVYDLLSPYLKPDVKSWLLKVTRPIAG